MGNSKFWKWHFKAFSTKYLSGLYSKFLKVHIQFFAHVSGYFLKIFLYFVWSIINNASTFFKEAIKEVDKKDQIHFIENDVSEKKTTFIKNW